MSKWDKLLLKIANLSKDVRFEELKKILESYGYHMNMPRGGSSHHTFRKEGKNPICNLTEYLTKRTFQRETIREEVGNDGKPREIKGFGEFHREKMKHL